MLFELIGARYENRSVLVIANEPFSSWGRIFGSDAMTLAAVDRLVHRSHSTSRATASAPPAWPLPRRRRAEALHNADLPPPESARNRRERRP